MNIHEQHSTILLLGFFVLFPYKLRLEIISIYHHDQQQ